MNSFRYIARTYGAANLRSVPSSADSETVIVALPGDTDVEVGGNVGAWLCVRSGPHSGFMHLSVIQSLVTPETAWRTTVTADSLNVRATPGGGIIGSVAEGVQMDVVGFSDGWLRVAFRPRGAETGVGFVDARCCDSSATRQPLALDVRLTPAQMAEARKNVPAGGEEQGDAFEALQLRVGYRSQRDNAALDSAGTLIESRSGQMCNLTSLAMCLSYLGIDVNRSEGQLEDALERIRSEAGLGARTTISAWEGVASRCGAGFRCLPVGAPLSDSTTDQAWWNEVVRPKLRKGRGVMFSINGHIVRLAGITDDGLLVDDPYGHVVLEPGGKGQWTWIAKNPYQGEPGPTVGNEVLWRWKDVRAHRMLWVGELRLPPFVEGVHGGSRLAIDDQGPSDPSEVMEAVPESAPVVSPSDRAAPVGTGERMQLPLVLAGPIVRRVDEASATVWVALAGDGEVTLRVMDQATGAIVGAGTRTPVAVGPVDPATGRARLSVVAVTARPVAGPFEPGREYLYNLYWSDGRDLTSPGVLSAPDSEGDGISTIAYAGRKLPSFRLMAAKLADVRLAHGSCRKAHGKGIDALTLLDRRLEAALTRGEDEPVQALFLTGDQIYADDVSPRLLEGIQQAATLIWGADAEASTDLSGWPNLLPGEDRADLMRSAAGFTSTAADRHLVTYAEYSLMYLFAWSGALWGLVDQSGPDEDQLRNFKHGLNRVRRVLANVPVWMTFDDHEVTDDWNRTAEWVERVGASPMGRRVIRNALAAYALFQHWGNAPSDFEAGTPGGDFLEAVHGWDARDSAAGTARIWDLVWVPTFAGTPCPSCALRWSWHVDTALFRVISPDCRTRRGLRGVNDKPALLGKTAREELLALGREDAINIVISPTPLLGKELFERVSNIIHWVEEHSPDIFRRTNMDDAADCEAWAGDPEAQADVVRGLTEWGNVLVLSGDVHYGLATALSYGNGRIVNFTSSSLANRSWPGFLIGLVNRTKGGPDLEAAPREVESPIGVGAEPSGRDAPPRALIEGLFGPQGLALDGAAFATEVISARSAGSEGATPEAVLEGTGRTLPAPEESDLLGEPHVGLIHFPPGKVVQRLIYHGDHGVVGEQRHEATFKV